MSKACDVVRNGGLLVAPSGPCLANDLVSSAEYKCAIMGADIVLLDSGLVALWSRIFWRSKLNRVSGLAFLKNYLMELDFKHDKCFWVMPNESESEANLKWLEQRFNLTFNKEFFYAAPKYPKTGRIEDPLLLRKILDKKPKHIFIQLGGGVQERLGLYLKESLDENVSILCTGAALAFLSGQQVIIPRWADHFFLGWLFRCFSNPRLFIPRYLKALKLIYLLISFGRNSPANNA